MSDKDGMMTSVIVGRFMNSEMLFWLRKNVPFLDRDQYWDTIYGNIVAFVHEEDAILFKLKFQL